MNGKINRQGLFFEQIMYSAVFVVLYIIILFSSTTAQVVIDDPRELKGVDVIERSGETIPLDLTFTDDNGDKIILSRYFNDDKPVILIMGYYTCPMLCNLVFNGITNTLSESDWLLGKQFKIINVSIDPTETSLVAGAKKKNYLSELGRYESEDGWVFLTGDSSQSAALAEAIGFKYYYDDDTEQYAHPALLTILSPTGKISRYLYGIEFKERDLRFSLIDASEGKVGTTIDRLILSCFHYDPSAGGYVAIAGNIMMFGGLLTVLLLGLFLSSFWIKEFVRKKRVAAAQNI